MARKENRRNNKEFASNAEKESQADADLSSEEESSGEKYEALKEPEEMNLQMESIYKIREEIQLEWPSLTVCMGEEDGKILIEQTDEKNCSQIVELQASLGSKSSNSVRKSAAVHTPSQVNRIRASNGKVYAITDRSLHVYDSQLKPIINREINGGYGLSTYKTSLFYGDGNEVVLQANIENSSLEKFSVDGSCIYSVAGVSENEVFAATQSLDLVDFRCKDSKRYLTLPVDINSIAYNGENLILAGDDEGALRLIDMRNEQILEEIRFHQSPISHVQFSSNEIFASASSCEVVIWDMAYEETEEWEYHKYLSFVHQGQSYYKDFEFISDDVIIATSKNGLCIFSPQLEIQSE
ncbi:ribosome assembly protein RRB1 [Nematocida minor]|uniref:ribosome assembly protein RRB1 n=1 Tax=Nematocida minor TaxID=1912983 RepID=UPI00221F7E45|nr:ribosome assembly protein RRB1 [Nematocida minor]KAI5191191.1 ribosome assembly protein RRB1 [Nematocida minor]